MKPSLQELSARFFVNAEEGTKGNFPVFLNKIRGKKVAAIADLNTAAYFSDLRREIEKNSTLSFHGIKEREPVADERTAEEVRSFSSGADYILAVGSGTLNDLAKAASARLHIPCGVLATAPSMDGYVSGISALIEGGKKVSYPTQIPSDVLLDEDILSSAPTLMVGAGVGDILAKDCSLADWMLSHILKGEEYNREAAGMMRTALERCKDSLSGLKRGEKEGMHKLISALLVSGYAMIVAGSSRPASGAEHHMSHFLETDFLRRGERIPLHGVKVGLGTAVSQYLYHTLRKRGCRNEEVLAVADSLPVPEETLSVLHAFSCPTRFSELGVPRESFLRMLKEAHLVRERFTVLRMYHEEGYMTEDVLREVEERFY